jgi:hypothetical protein
MWLARIVLEYKKSFCREESPPVLALLGAVIMVLMLVFELCTRQIIGSDTHSVVKNGITGTMPASTSLLDSAADAILAGHSSECQLTFTYKQYVTYTRQSMKSNNIVFHSCVYGLLTGTPTMLIIYTDCPTDWCTNPDLKLLAACTM